MALPSSGAISFSQINTELGVSATATRSLNDSTTRTLFGVASGTISMSQGYGKANQFSFSIASNQTNANLRSLAVAAGWNQSSKVVATINSGITVSSNATGTPALTVNGSFPNGVTLVNNGVILAKGGAGGNGQAGNTAAGAGGTALSVSVAVSVNNAGVIAGGGGGGGGGAGGRDEAVVAGGGGGGGGSGYGAAGAGGSGYPGYPNGGAGTAGGLYTGGAKGIGGTALNAKSGDGGVGGSYGAAGSPGLLGPPLGNGTFSSGGAGGYATVGNASITWLATGTRYGSIA